MKSGFDKLIVVISVLLLVLVAGMSVFLNDTGDFPELKSNVLTGASVSKLAESGKDGIKTTSRVGVQQSTTNCWSTANSDSESACEANDDCVWHSDAWGSWCELKGCWNLESETACSESNTSASANYINKSCSWSTTSETGWCTEVDCWNYDGTSENTCTNNIAGLNCSWVDEYDESSYSYPCEGPPEKQCWTYQSNDTCLNVTGCTWGACERQSCYDQTTSTACVSEVGFNGQACKWNSQYAYCYESGCWDYTDSTTCTDNGCSWSGGSCSKKYCSDFGYQNESFCTDNTAGLSCNWNDPWCEESSCSSVVTQGACQNSNSSSGKPCVWETYSGGYCEEIECWQWDGYKEGGNESNCLANSTFYGLGCTWNNDSKGVGGVDGWCYKDSSADDCTGITKERDCIDTHYCFWNYTANTCQEPGAGSTTEWVAWYPGCELFSGESSCTNVTGCQWVVSEDLCSGNVTITDSDPGVGGIRCEYINNSNMCTKMTMLPHCCEWQAGSCTENKLTTKCWDQMEELPEGGSYCEDYNAFTDQTICNKIAGDPWYMPCKWDNKSTTDSGDDRCIFKFDQVFDAGEENLIYLDSKQTCESAGGKWVVDMYASTNDPASAVALSMGHCEEDFGGKRNCNSDCYACDYKSDGTNHSSSNAAESACYSSKLGICSFTSDSTQPNGYGTCKPGAEFKKGIATNCDSDCGSCTYMGSATAAEPEYKPSYFCKNSKVTGGCKWIPDIDYPTDESRGRCAKKAEKSCEDRCDLCTTEDHCTNYGKKSGNTTADTACTWEASTNTCSLKSGGDQMEICWDGIDNNNDGKMDCADGQCWSDSFCGGGFMAGFGGLDCFGYNTGAECANAGCAWIDENWGSWCDMPGANCWANDGNQASCQADGNCTWHSGFGGFCEENWTAGGTCMGINEEEACNGNATTNNCTWVVDSHFQDNSVGGVMGWCQSNYEYIGEWYDCIQEVDSSVGEAGCISSGTQDSNGNYPCNWQNSTGGESAGHEGPETYGGGWCDSMKFACHQFENQGTCEDQTNATYNHSQFCKWKTGEWGGWCESLSMSGTDSASSCWSQTTTNDCEAIGCAWVSGFCDPVGFGNDMGFGGGAGSGSSMGGSGSTCFKYDGNQSGCEETQGCSWFAEGNAFCDVKKGSNCPQYSFSKVDCEAQPACTYNDQQNFCDEKPFMCFWNASYSNGQDDAGIPGTTDEEECESNELCGWTTWNTCEPICHNASSSNANICVEGNFNATNGTANVSACTWTTGWCNPGMTTQFFKEMQGGAIIPLGTDTEGDVSPPEVDIVDFGMKDMGPSFGFGIRVAGIDNASMCNGVNLGENEGLGRGFNSTTFYWYLDTDGADTGGCSSQDSNAYAGFEFYFKSSWSWNPSAGDSSESNEAYKCVSGSWNKAPIPLSTFKQKACQEIGGGMVAVEKYELEKFPTLYTTGEDIRVYVVTANETGNITDPTDTSGIGYITPGAVDQDIEKWDLFAWKNATDRISDGMRSGYISYDDIDCWTESGCGDYQCKGHSYCVQNGYGVEAATFTDTRIPKVIGLVGEPYVDSGVMKVYTDKPANMSLQLYGTDQSCADSSAVGLNLVHSTNNLTEVRNFTLWHLLEINSDTVGVAPAAATTYYYKITFCDDESKCGASKCSSFKTADSESDCPFCRFVVKIEAPSTWNMTYDLDADGIYEFDQNAYNVSVGMLVNYTTGRRAHIKMLKDDNSSWIEFKNVTLTKTGLSSTVRKFTDSTNMLEGTRADELGNTIGYVGMVDDVRDKIVHNLYPQVCEVKFPKGDINCTELWHCNNDNTICLNRTAEATLITEETSSCIWKIPYCEFSNWGGGNANGGSSSSSSSSSGGGGGGSSSTVEAVTTTETVTETTPTEKEESKEVEKPTKDSSETTKKTTVEKTAPTIKKERKALAGQAWGQFGEVLTDLSWLWVTFVIVMFGVGAYFYLRKKK